MDGFADRRTVDRIVQEMGPALANLAQRIRAGFQGEGAPFVLLTGCRRGVGCSTVALALALAAAEYRSVLLMEGDLTQPGLSAGLGVFPETGWEESLKGSFPFTESLHYIEAKQKLAFLPLGRPIEAPDKILANPALGLWQSQFRKEYDLVIVDGGSVGNSGVRWASWVDVALMVCDSGQKLVDEWALAWDLLEERGVQVLGIVETFS
jgi:Mrp family chromosome partitioning ATPase